MSLLNLKTDLKSLKYGKDRFGGGNSDQPYIQTKIPTGENNTTPFDDGFVRGGALGAAKASLADTKRIFSFLKDLPKGPLFIARQVGLQFSNPKLERKENPDNPRSKNYIGPTRIYNLGINTLAQIPVNAFGIHLVRHGLLPVQDEDTKYLNVVNYNNTIDQNRLLRLTNNFELGDQDRSDLWEYSFTSVKDAKKKARLENKNQRTNIRNIKNENDIILDFNNQLSSGLNALSNTFLPPRQYQPLLPVPKFKKVKIDRKTLFIDNYLGGPGSVYGIGSTIIKRYDSTENKDKIEESFANSLIYSRISRDGTPVNYLNAIGNFIDGEKNIDSYPDFVDNLNYYDDIKTGIDQNVIPYNTSLKTYAELQAKIEKQKTKTRPSVADSSTIYNNTNQFGIYGDIFNQTSFNNKSSNLNNPIFSPETTSDTPEYFNGDDVIKINISWDKVTREARVGSGRQDQINLTPLFEGPTGTIGDNILIEGKPYNINDLVKFRIQSLNYNNPGLGKWMIFRAYITQFSDSTDAAWNEIKYAGRGDKFYVYDGFSRKVNIGFKVAALSAEEMKPMYQKLNYLMGNLMGSYENDLLHGTLVKMTVGNWFDGQDGILNSLSYTVPQDSPWEIDINKDEHLVLPHIIEVSMTFTPIGSQTNGVNKISEKNSTTSHIAQNIGNIQYASTYSKLG